MGWQAFKNGRLLREASGGFDALVTVDQNLKHQQNLDQFPIAVNVIAVPANTLDQSLACATLVNEALARVKPGQLVEIKPPSA